MPMPMFDLIDQPASTGTIQVSLEEVYSVIQSLLLLAKEVNHPGLAEWVGVTRQAMTRAERKTNELVLIGFHYAVLPEKSWYSFPTYVDHLANMDPVALRDKMLAVYENLPPCQDDDFQPSTELMDAKTAITSADHYLTFLRQRFSSKYIDESIERAVYDLLLQPAEMQRVIVDHLRLMWKKYLSQEWQRSRPLLHQALQAARQVNVQGLDFQEAAHLVTGQDLSNERWEANFADARQLILVPHPHIGPYTMSTHSGDGVLILFFGAHIPKGSHLVAPDLHRAELLVRVEALADDTRLKILRLIAERGEMRSQQIIDEMELSQSAASRQLTQLSAAGYLKERRCDGAKCYSINPERVIDTLQSLANYLLIDERNRV